MQNTNNGAREPLTISLLKGSGDLSIEYRCTCGVVYSALVARLRKLGMCQFCNQVWEFEPNDLLFVESAMRRYTGGNGSYADEPRSQHPRESTQMQGPRALRAVG